MTASFPYITPASTLPTLPARRLADSGFFDDYGIVVSTKWIEHHLQDLKDVDIALVKISLTDIEKKRLTTNREANPANAKVNSLSSLLSPVEAVAAARSSTMNFRNDGDIARLQNRIEDIGDGQLEVFEFELPVAVSLSWRLTEFEKRQLQYAIDPQYIEFRDIEFDLGSMTQYGLPTLSAKEYDLFVKHMERLEQGRVKNLKMLETFGNFIYPKQASSTAP